MRATEQKEAAAWGNPDVGKCVRTLSPNHPLKRPPQLPPHVPAAGAIPSPLLARAEKTGILLGRALHCLLQGLAGFRGSSRAGCSCKHEVTSPGSAQQLQATSVSERCSCLYSCSPFPLPLACRHVTADASHQYNGDFWGWYQ